MNLVLFCFLSLTILNWCCFVSHRFGLYISMACGICIFLLNLKDFSHNYKIWYVAYIPSCFLNYLGILSKLLLGLDLNSSSTQIFIEDLNSRFLHVLEKHKAKLFSSISANLKLKKPAEASLRKTFEVTLKKLS